jgi:hypothetical protein
VDHAGTGISVGTAGIGLIVWNTDDGVYIGNANNNGVYVWDAAKNGIHINRADSSGIRIEKATRGITVDSVLTTGFYVRKARTGFQVDNAGHYGVNVENAGYAGVNVVNADNDGVHASGKNHGGAFFNDTTGSYYSALHVVNTYGSTSSERIANFYAGWNERFYFQGDGNAYADGNWNTFKKNRKGEYESFSTIESPNKELIDHGKGRLSGGEAYINFNESFSEFVSSEIPVEVTVTPVGSYSGLYIARKDKDGFLVKSGAGDPDCELTWIAIGREKGCEQRAEVGDIEEEERMTRMMEEERRLKHERMKDR